MIRRHRLFWLYLALIILAGATLLLPSGQLLKTDGFTKKNETPSLSDKEMTSPKSTLMGRTGTYQINPGHQHTVNRKELSITKTTAPEINTNNEIKVPLQQQNAQQLWDYWKTLLQHSELQQIPVINALLAERLRKNLPLWIYQDIRSLLSDPGIPIGNKVLLLDLLTETATPESLHELLELSGLGAESPLYAFILQEISRIGDIRWEGRFHEELSPLLEAAWLNPAITDEQLLTAIGTALAKIGSPQGISRLLASIAGNPTETTSYETDRIRQSIAFNSAANVDNPSATQIFTDCINRTDAVTPLSEVCLEGLASIGTPEATNAILDHAENATGGSARPIAHALNKIESDKSRALMEQAPKHRKFQAPEITTAINSIANDITASTAISVPAQDR